MNKSIWTKEIDTALYQLLGSLRLPDNSPVKVVFKYPDIDYDSDELTYPMIQITSMMEKFDEDRYDYNHPEVIIDRVGTVAVVEELAKPYKILYYIEPIAPYLEDINHLTLMLNHLFGRFYNLNVQTADGENAVVPMSRVTAVPMMELDTRKKRRLFKRTLVFNISAFADFGEQREVPVNIQNVIEEV